MEKPRKLYRFTVEMQSFGTSPEDAWLNIHKEPYNFIPYADCLPEVEEVPEDEW